MKKQLPPRWAEAALRALVRPRDRDTIAGDLLEEYRETVVPARGAFRARLWYCGQVLSFVRADGVTRLRSATLSNCFLWTLAAAVAEYVLLLFLPEKTGASVVTVVFWLTAALLVASVASGIRTAADARFIARVTAFWLPLFGVVTFLTVRATLFTPAPLVVAFLVCVAGAGFQGARRTGLLRTGSAAGLVIGIVTFLLGAVLGDVLLLPHPPYGAFLFPPAVAVIVGMAGAIFGKRFGRVPHANNVQLGELINH